MANNAKLICKKYQFYSYFIKSLMTIPQSTTKSETVMVVSDLVVLWRIILS